MTEILPQTDDFGEFSQRDPIAANDVSAGTMAILLTTPQNPCHRYEQCM